MWVAGERWKHCGGRRFGDTCAGDKAVDDAGPTVDQIWIPWISVSIVLRSLGSSWRSLVILSTAWRTVVWSLPPKARPTSARERE